MRSTSRRSAASTILRLAAAAIRTDQDSASMIVDLLHSAAASLDLDLAYVAQVDASTLHVIALYTRPGIAPDAEHVQALPTVRVDPTQLGQLFQNLIGNVIKFRRPEIVPVITITAAAEQGHWRFCIEDNGPGIDPAYSDRIFRMFQRLPTPGQVEGAGIGQALCKRIVERHAGRIWVESQVGAGTRMCFTQPMAGGSEGMDHL